MLVFQTVINSNKLVRKKKRQYHCRRMDDEVLSAEMNWTEKCKDINQNTVKMKNEMLTPIKSSFQRGSNDVP